MDAFVFDVSENSAVEAGGSKAKRDKMAKGCLVGSARKTLGDISNTQQWTYKQASQQGKHQFDSLTTKKYVENLTKENMALMKLLSDRNKVIELSRTEIQNLRTNLEIVQQQNAQLAHANSQMLGEVNLSRDRLRVLQHAMGCQNALLNVRKAVEKEKAKRERYQNTRVEVDSANTVEPGEVSQAMKGPGTTNKNQQPQNLALVPPIIEAVQNKKKADTKRSYLFSIYVLLFYVCCGILIYMYINGFPIRLLRRQSAIYENEEQETTEDLVENKNDNKRWLRRQLASAEPEEPQVTVSENKNEYPRKMRRQSARFKTEDLDITEEAKVNEEAETEDLNCPVSSLCDVVYESGSTCSLVLHEDEGKSEGQEFQRSSIRPLRRAAEKIKTYKELPINVKMRQ